MIISNQKYNSDNGLVILKSNCVLTEIFIKSVWLNVEFTCVFGSLPAVLGNGWDCHVL